MKRLTNIVLTTVYGIVALFWCYVLVSALVYSYSDLYVDSNSVGIIGGAENPALLFGLKTMLLSPIILIALFILCSFATVVIGMIVALRKQPRRSLHIAVCVLVMVSLLLFLLIPIQTYVVSLYLLGKFVSIVRYTQYIYYGMAGAMAMVHFMCAAKKGRVKEENL